MTAQEDPGPQQVERIVEVHDDAEPSAGRTIDGAQAAGAVAVVLFATGFVGALATGNVELATGLATVTVLFAGALFATTLADG